MIITIDGTAGSGKSTVARELARRLGIQFLDTGATYRAATLNALKCNVDLSDTESLVKNLSSMSLQISPSADGTGVSLNGQDVTNDIRSEEVSRNVHYVASSAEARNILVTLQRKIGLSMGDFVTEGRDQGSVVFPNADKKFYLDADPETRTLRRCKQLNINDQDEINRVLQEIIKRDQRDRNRSVGPLVIPEGAIILDSTNIGPDQIVKIMAEHVEAANA